MALFDERGNLLPDEQITNDHWEPTPEEARAAEFERTRPASEGEARTMLKHLMSHPVRRELVEQGIPFRSSLPEDSPVLHPEHVAIRHPKQTGAGPAGIRQLGSRLLDRFGNPLNR